MKKSYGDLAALEITADHKLSCDQWKVSSSDHDDRQKNYSVQFFRYFFSCFFLRFPAAFILIMLLPASSHF